MATKGSATFFALFLSFGHFFLLGESTQASLNLHRAERLPGELIPELSPKG